MAVDPTAPSPGVPVALEPEVPLGSSEIQGEGGVGPYKLAARRLRRNKTALAFGAMFLLIVVLCLCAPLYAKHVAHTHALGEPHHRHGRWEGRRLARRDPDRSDVDRPLLPGSRLERP